MNEIDNVILELNKICKKYSYDLILTNSNKESPACIIHSSKDKVIILDKGTNASDIKDLINKYF